MHHGLITEKRLLPERLVYGYYPEVVTNPGKEIRLLKELASSYLYKDILSFGPVKKPVILDKLLRALALQVGNEVSFMELSQIVGADKETIERYVDLLEKSYIILRVNALSRNVRNEIKKGKKIYFWDNGIRNAIIGNFQPWESRTDKGPSWENFIVMERIKHLSYSDFYGNIYFWRTSQNQEIDLIEEKDGSFTVFEFKTSPKKNPKIPVTFSKAYPVASYRVISPENVEAVLD
jgi:predicted AAA+ superfamily ATPase